MTDQTATRYLVQIDWTYPGGEQTEYLAVDTLTEARDLMKGYIANRKAEHMIRTYIWRESEPDSYVPDGGDPLDFWTYDLALDQALYKHHTFKPRRRRAARRAH